MIYTLTLNPTVDMNIEMESLLPGKVNRSSKTMLCPGGKGINVSRTLAHFGIKSKIMGFFGGFTGEYAVKTLEEMGFDTEPVFVSGETRINVFVSAKNGEYDIVNPGPLATEENRKKLFDLIEKMSSGDILTINGSAIDGMEDEDFEKIMEICTNNFVKVVADISLPVLKKLMKWGPWLIKPNKEELEEIFGLTANTEDEIINSLKELKKLGGRNILLTLGEKGAYFYNGKEILRCNSKQVNQVSSVCAGDGFLGAFLAVYDEEKENSCDALKTAAATGANVAESYGLGDFSKIEAYKKDILIKQADI